LRWRLDERYVKINGVTHYHWRAVDQKGEVRSHRRPALLQSGDETVGQRPQARGRPLAYDRVEDNHSHYDDEQAAGPRLGLAPRAMARFR
jgi:hypothetical protein